MESKYGTGSFPRHASFWDCAPRPDRSIRPRNRFRLIRGAAPGTAKRCASMMTCRSSAECHGRSGERGRRLAEQAPDRCQQDKLSAGLRQPFDFGYRVGDTYMVSISLAIEQRFRLFLRFRIRCPQTSLLLVGSKTDLFDTAAHAGYSASMGIAASGAAELNINKRYR